jgi:hypothetical protein
MWLVFMHLDPVVELSFLSSLPLSLSHLLVWKQLENSEWIFQLRVHTTVEVTHPPPEDGQPYIVILWEDNHYYFP